MSREAIQHALRRMPAPGDATEEEVYEALREHAVAAWEAHGAPADHPIDEEWGREMARKIMEKRK